MAERRPPWSGTKIVATLGPASWDQAALERLLLAGVDVCRLNFSHGTQAHKAEIIERIREVAERHTLPVAILADLCGPKIRLNRVSGDQLALHAGDQVAFVRGDADVTAARLTVTYAEFVDEVDVGQRIYIDDGLVRLLVLEKTADEVRCTVTVGGPISSRKGVNLPDTRLSVPALTDKDVADLRFAVGHGVDYVALSFVRQPSDVTALRDRLRELSAADMPVILKIEKTEALRHLDELIALADGIMVARGDLGVEMDVWQVPIAQKRITRMCRESGKPVIIATQMLQSMVDNPMPTRAEVSDVANAIYDGADAVMLSGETAVGKYPSLAVEMMEQIAQVTENEVREHGYAVALDETVSASSPRTSAIAGAALNAARHLRARLIVAWTATGATARLLSRGRLGVPIVALTTDPQAYRRLSLYFGVLPILVDPFNDLHTMTGYVDDLLVQRGLAKDGDLIVVVSSTRPRTPGATDTTLVHRIGERPAPPA